MSAGGLHVCSPALCSHLPMMALNRITHGVKSGTLIEPVLAYAADAQLSVKLESFTCLTMSKLPTKFRSSWLVPF